MPLPDLKPEDIKVNITKVETMDAKTRETKTKHRGFDAVGDDQLMVFKEMYERKIPLLASALETEKQEGKQVLKDKIDRLTEKYGLVIKEIQKRKG